MDKIGVLFGVLPALIIFLYGIENFSKEIQQVAGNKFRKLLRKVTNNPWAGSFFGAIVTSLIQSSSATTVITVSLVNAGIISFAASLGLIFGSNVGTTITAQLIALKLTSFAPVFIVVGFILKFFGGKYKFAGKPLFFFGLVFYGLMLVSNNVGFLQEDPEVLRFFASFTNIFVALAVGFVFTAIVQSSSVTTGLVVVLAQNQLIDLRMALPLLIGANIGSSTTALLASVGLNLHAKRVGVANFFFNIGGALIFMPFLSIFGSFIQDIGGDPAQQVANAHMIFNIITAVIFLLLIRRFENFIKKIVPGEEEEILFKTKYLRDPMPEDNTKFIKEIKKEIVYSLDITISLYEQAISMFMRPTKQGIMRLEKFESLNDFLDEKITEALLHVSNRKLTDVQARKTVLLVQISNSIEQLGDLGEDIAALSRDMHDRGRQMSFESIEAVDNMFREFKKDLVLLKENFPNVDKKLRAIIKQHEDTVLDLATKKYQEHMERLQEDRKYDGSTFVESVSLMEASVSKSREIRKYMERYTKLSENEGKKQD